MWCGGASPCDLPEREALDALASLARRVGASAVLVPHAYAAHVGGTIIHLNKRPQPSVGADLSAFGGMHDLPRDVFNPLIGLHEIPIRVFIR